MRFLFIFLCLIPSFATDSLGEALKEGTLILNLRFRVEAVDQETKSKDATAATLRTRLGYKTANYRGWHALLEFENITEIGDERYNNTVNGEVRFPVVADPEDTEVNRVALYYTGFEGQEWVLGRQRIIFDNARFVGNVGWRQNEQTFDGLLWNWKKTKRTKITVAYLENANLIFGDSHPTNSDRRMETLVANGQIQMGTYGKLAVFAYLLDFKNQPTQAHKNLGFRFDGKHKLSEDWFWTHDLSYVDQSEYQDGADSLDNAYYNIGLGAGKGAFSAKLVQEVLEGNGQRGFFTPLATLHAFNGWADLFLATPVTGLVDRHLVLAYKQNGWHALLKGHDFEADLGSADFGSEIDGLLTKKLNKRVSVGFKFADYQKGDLGVDVTKIWGFGQYVW